MALKGAAAVMVKKEILCLPITSRIFVKSKRFERYTP
jgi:hypothetical protein